MKKTFMLLTLGSLVFCTGCAKELVCTKEGEAFSTKVTMAFDENEKLTSINVDEKTDVSKLGVKQQEIDDKYLKDYRKKYTENKDYENIIVYNEDSIITVTYDITLDSSTAPKNYDAAKEKYKNEGFTCE